MSEKTITHLPVPDFVPPSSMVTDEMIQYARVDDSWHFAQNLNAMMRNGYCRTCKLTPTGCEREGCGARIRIAQST